MSGKIIEEKSYPMTDTFGDLLACMKCFHQMFKEDYELDGVAISFCGLIDVENAVIDAVWAQGIPWRDVIQKELGLHCEIENDVNCAALSEVYFGKAQDIKDMAFFVIGTGVGGAIIRHRQVCPGVHRYGGEFGMMPLSMVYKMEEANAENALCKQVIQQFYHNLAMGVFNVQHTLDSEMIMFGGVISQRDDFVERLMEEYNIIREKMGMDIITPNLKCCTYRQDANLLGALANYIGRK